MKSFNVIIYNFNSKKFQPYDVMPYFINEYYETENKPISFSEFRKFIEDKSHYRYWSRCEYEIVLQSWPKGDIEQKWDIHKQIMMNINIITKILIENVNGEDNS